jgi:hypothetical protein
MEYVNRTRHRIHRVRLCAAVYLSVWCLALSACGIKLLTLSSSGEVEAKLISETARFAGMQQVSVRGVITDAQYTGTYPNGDKWEATGWYSAGVAYYNRAMVAKTVSIEPEAYKETATNVACHEVCHYLWPSHNMAHWQCMNKWAQPTYPIPNGTSKIQATEAY